MSETEAAEAGRRHHRTWLLRFEEALSRRPRGYVILAGLLLLAIVGLVDALSGRFDVTLFYLLPVALVTFSRGRWMGIAFAAIAALAFGAADIANDVTTLDTPVTYWNWLTRFYAYALVVLLISPMREALLWEREAAEKEAEAAEQLRALMELRDAAESSAWHHADDPEAVELRARLQALDQDFSDLSTG